MKWLLLSLAMLMAAPCLALGFEAEELDFTLHLDTWELYGLYHFANYDDHEVTQLILFPVPVDSLCLQPELLALEVVEGSGCSCELLTQDENGLGFSLQMPEKSFCTLLINYKQELKGGRASYIITTANAWGRPLPYAKYTLHVGADVKLTSLPFPDPQGEEGLYYWEFTDFQPQQELEVGFSSWR